MSSYAPTPGSGLIFMKVGVHAQESLEDILVRKRKELSDAGMSFWGYGGNTCHPTTKVQPFVSKLVNGGQQVYLCMHQMTSKHFADPVRAEEYSADGKEWRPVPPEINVMGSRYALVIDSLEEAEFELDLAQTRVGIGVQEGRIGSEYISGRVDKACLQVSPEPTAAEDSKSLRIGLVAKLGEPYAVLLR